MKFAEEDFFLQMRAKLLFPQFFSVTKEIFEIKFHFFLVGVTYRKFQDNF